MSDVKFVCECEEYCRSACEGLGFYREVKGKKYCVLHCPVQDKVDDFNVVFHNKLSSFEYDFQGVYFPTEVRFAKVNFVSAADFSSATFSATAHFLSATFSEFADFSGATFNAVASFAETAFKTKVDFSGATFIADVYFWNATFGSNAEFRETTFTAAANFSSATFTAAADFKSATFTATADFRFVTFCAAADFRSATIESSLRFMGKAQLPVFVEEASLNLQLAQINKPEQMIFHTVRLQPHWFVNVDSRKFEFTNVKWSESLWANAKQKLRQAVTDWHNQNMFLSGLAPIELRSMSEVENEQRLLSIANRQLATNAEDNHRYAEAAKFRYASMDVQRWPGWTFWTLDWWYWLVSGYGERIPRAAICLLVLLLSFGYLFTKVGFETKAAPEVAAIVQEITPTPEPLKEMPLPSFWDGLNYAMSAALFQRPEPKAHSNWAKTCVSLEMIFVPLQAALLALAIRRRFMR